MLRKDLLESGAGIVVILIAKKAALDASSKALLVQLDFDQPRAFNWSLHRFVVSYSIRIRYIADHTSAW